MKAVVFTEWAKVREVTIARDDAHAQELIAAQGGVKPLMGHDFHVVNLVDPDEVIVQWPDESYKAGQESVWLQWLHDAQMGDL